jgi:hypothetical protein
MRLCRAGIVGRAMRKLEISPYYPPRARWYSPVLRLADLFRHITWLDRVQLPDAMSWGRFFAALLIPGLAFRLRGERMIGNLILTVYMVLGAVFILWLGSSVTNVAFGLMMSLHATSILFLCRPWLAGMRLRWRLLLSIAMLLVLAGLIYSPLRRQVERRWLMPVRAHGRVVIVNTSVASHDVGRGDWVSYRIDGGRYEEAVLWSGLALQRVLGLPGDRVRFTPSACLINDVSWPHQDGMPSSGGYVVPENHWFIWPDPVITRRGHTTESTKDSVLLLLSDVDQRQFVGRPFKRWFWRTQGLE